MANLPPLVPEICAADLPIHARRLGEAGFPLLWVGDGAVDAGVLGVAWRDAQADADGQGGWPTIRLAARDEPRLGMAELLVVGGSLRAKGIAPVVEGASMAGAQLCFEAGAESLVLRDEIIRSEDPAALLWEAQALRWHARPPLGRGQGLVLAGGSGCGKSTLAQALATRLGLPAVDLDERVVRHAGKPIARIFAEEGEPWFRRLESELTCEAFRSSAVFALGGGAWESEEVRRAARASGHAILWIAEIPGRVWERISHDPARPLAQDRSHFLARWRLRTRRWMELPMILPLGRTARQVAEALTDPLRT